MNASPPGDEAEEVAADADDVDATPLFPMEVVWKLSMS